MWKQCARARRLPSERRTKAAGVNCNQHQVGGPGKMLGGGLLDLACAGEMDVAGALVDAGATELAGGLGGLPKRRSADLVDGVRHRPRPLSCSWCAAPEPPRTATQYTAAAPRVTGTVSIRGFVHSPDVSLG